MIKNETTLVNKKKNQHCPLVDKEKKQHCPFYKYLPPSVEHRILCTGVDIWPRCAQYDVCLSRSKASPYRAKALKLLLALDQDEELHAGHGEKGV